MGAKARQATAPRHLSRERARRKAAPEVRDVRLMCAIAAIALAAQVAVLAIVANVATRSMWDAIGLCGSPAAMGVCVASMALACIMTMLSVIVCLSHRTDRETGASMEHPSVATFVMFLVTLAIPAGMAMARVTAVRQAFSPERVVSVMPAGNDSYWGLPRWHGSRSELAVVEFHVDDGSATGRSVCATAGELGYVAVIPEESGEPHDVAVTDGRALGVPASAIEGAR